MQNSINESICIIVELYYLGLYVQYFGTDIKSVVHRNKHGKNHHRLMYKRGAYKTRQDVV